MDPKVSMDAHPTISIKIASKKTTDPYHKMYTNKLDPDLYTKQDEMVVEIYSAIRNIRLIFANHPSNWSMKILNYPITGEKKIRVY